MLILNFGKYIIRKKQYQNFNNIFDCSVSRAPSIASQNSRDIEYADNGIVYFCT